MKDGVDSVPLSCVPAARARPGKCPLSDAGRADRNDICEGALVGAAEVRHPRLRQARLGSVRKTPSQPGLLLRPRREDDLAVGEDQPRAVPKIGISITIPAPR